MASNISGGISLRHHPAGHPGIHRCSNGRRIGHVSLMICANMPISWTVDWAMETYRACGATARSALRPLIPAGPPARLPQPIQTSLTESRGPDAHRAARSDPRSCVRRDHPHPWEIGPISAPVSSQQGKLDDRRMGADVEVRECGCPGSAAAAIPGEGLPGEKGGLPG